METASPNCVLKSVHWKLKSVKSEYFMLKNKNIAAIDNQNDIC